ncbi:MAG TPA: PadR family transcriptional regulator [Solirubrobacteraceae bacterium]|nr:PadR family transcriptional regulator [Solirubrobacteraceae bacterium]
MRSKNDELGRWSDPSLLVLASLAEGEKHGYAMVADIEAMAGVHLGPGTLYGALSRLESQGLIEPVEADGRRRPYRITGAGAELLRERLRTIAAVAETGLTRLRAAGASA